LDRFNSTHQAFLEQLTESIGIVLNTIEANTRTENLLKQSQSLAAELQKGQQELQKTNQELQEKARSNLAKDQFLAMLSHELRTPLTPVIASAVELEGEEALPENIQESLHMIRRNVELEARLIDDLLDLTRISKGKVQLNFEIVDAHSLLQNALEIYQSEIERKHLVLRLDLAAQKVHLRADPARLQQIFWNLINNAVKFTPENGQIHISTSNDSDEQLHVEIADTGLGIEPETLPKIFEDLEDTNKSLTNLLRRRGYYVQSAMSLQSALELSAKEEFDVLISDLGLPDGSGIELMQKLSSDRPLFGIALTGFGMEDDIRKS